MKRDNWWWFGFWFFGGPSWRYPKWRLKYDLRCWVFGWTYQFGGWSVCFDPLELMQLIAREEPGKPDLKSVA